MAEERKTLSDDDILATGLGASRRRAETDDSDGSDDDADGSDSDSDSDDS
jgi:hypothetical protein